MFCQFFPQIVKSLLIQSDVVNHVVKVGVYDFDDLLDIVSTLATVLDF